MIERKHIDKLLRSPLVLVLAQVRFSPVAAMSTYLPFFQDSLRQRYPHYEARVVSSIQFADKATLLEEPHWILIDRNRSESITLTSGFVTISTNRYDGFEDFLERFSFVLTKLAEHAKLDLSERLGLRYVNMVRPGPAETFADYFRSTLLGFSQDLLGIEDSLNRFEFVGRTEEGKLVVRAMEFSDGKMLPPDLRDSVLKFSEVLSSGEKIRFLDVDHYAEATSDFSVPDILSVFWSLHDKCELAFKSSVTAHALEVWKGAVDAQ